MSPERYVLIAGNGRSGTNWLLEMLNESPQTHCRNEPNECAGSALSKLPWGGVSCLELDETLQSTWDDAMMRSARSFGERDDVIKVDKDHFFHLASRTGLVRLAKAKLPRKVLSRALPVPLPQEWPIPSWIEDERRKNQSLPVIKMNMIPGWAVWVLRNRPQAHVVHIVRHPGGYLNSLMKRLWSTLDPEKVLHDNRNRLAQVAASEPVWAGRFGDLASISAVDAELWYWRYCTETIHRAGEGQSRYQLVKYEDLARNPVEVARSVYDGCSLLWDDHIEQAIRQTSQNSETIAKVWRDKLSAEHITAVERILRDSMTRDWWN